MGVLHIEQAFYYTSSHLNNNFDVSLMSQLFSRRDKVYMRQNRELVFDQQLNILCKFDSFAMTTCVIKKGNFAPKPFNK